MKKYTRNLILLGVGLLLILIATFTSFTQIEEGTVGVRRVFGQVQPNSLKSGFHIINPFTTKVEEVTTLLEAVSIKVDSSSSDLQSVTTQVTVNISVDPTQAPEMLSNIGNLPKITNVILHPAIEESVKATTAKFKAEALIADRESVRNGITDATRKFVQYLLKSKGVEGCITIESVALTDFNFSDEFNKAIESKVKAEQMALQAKNEKTMRTTQAEATEVEAKKKTDAEAYQTQQAAIARAAAIEAESKALADAISLEGEALRKNPEILDLRKIEKWNGETPVYLTSENASQFIQLPVTNKRP